MSDWTTLTDVKKRLLGEWQKGLYLRAFLQNEEMFPRRISLKHPSGRELNQHFAEVKVWIDGLKSDLQKLKQPGLRLEYREVDNRVVGRNMLPVAMVVESRSDLLRLIKSETQFALFQKICEQVLPKFAGWHPWFVDNPFLVIDNADNWLRFMAVTDWLRARPRPDIYLRQLDLAGIDTKFIESNRKVLGELFDLALPDSAINSAFKGVGGFEQRYGFRVKPVTVRFRILDSGLTINGLSDLQIRIDEFARLRLPLRKVFITENEINGLAFPPLSGAIVIFGLGYGLDRLAAVDWLKNVAITYWGDIDTHGFAMLDQLRSYFPQARSMLMNRATLLANQQFWGAEPKPLSRDLPRLTPEEQSLYQELIANSLAKSLRLEQERIPYGLLQQDPML